MNINREEPTSVSRVQLLNAAILTASSPRDALVYEMTIVQQIVSPNSGVLTGANFNQDNRSVTSYLWRRYYRDVIKHTADVINATRDDASQSNLYHMTRIWRALAFLILTDTYGDIPYFEAGNGFIEQNNMPKYDDQKTIYTDIFKELEQASAALDPNKPIFTDILYGGNIGKWKRLGYSVLLRAAMRLSKVESNTAQAYVSKAVAGGLMQSNQDNAVILHSDIANNFRNDMSWTLAGTEKSNFYLTKPFVDYLKAKNDPRLEAIAVRFIGARSGPEQDNTAIRSTRSDQQIGMPMGYDNGSIVPVAQALGLASFYDFSQVDRQRMAKTAAPYFMVTFAQTQLLLAEAVIRGWASGNATELFAQGIRAHLNQMASYDAGSTIQQGKMDEYVQANPLNMNNALEDINTQYWVASFLNGPEAWANFRRSGYPALTPNPFPGSEIPAGTFIRRLTYPDSEQSVNAENLQRAVSRQGPDKLETRVWWDK